MPELPEVETVTRGLEEKILNTTLTEVTTRREGLRTPFPADLQACAGAHVVSLSRRGKFVLMGLSCGQTILLHLGMSGRLTFMTPYTPVGKHDHISFYFSNGTQPDVDMRLNDPRRFGVVDIHPTENLATNRHLKNLGLEPLAADFTPDALYAITKKRKVAMKQAIMNSQLIVGVGNIYASEALFRAGIRPDVAAHRLSKARVAALHGAIQTVLQAAIAAGGTTLRDYVQTDGTLGYFQHQFYVYGRAGEPCKTCGTRIKKTTQANRTSFYCPTCQV